MQKAKYTAEFKEEAVRQVIDRGHSVVDVAKRLGIGDGLLYTWVKKFKAANVVSFINKEVVNVLDSPNVKQKLAAQEFSPKPTSPEAEFGKGHSAH